MSKKKINKSSNSNKDINEFIESANENNVNKVYKNGDTPLMIACREYNTGNDNKKVMELIIKLIEFGADLEMKNNSGETAKTIAGQKATVLIQLIEKANTVVKLKDTENKKAKLEKKIKLSKNTESTLELHKQLKELKNEIVELKNINQKLDQQLLQEAKTGNSENTNNSDNSIKAIVKHENSNQKMFEVESSSDNSEELIELVRVNNPNKSKNQNKEQINKTHTTKNKLVINNIYNISESKKELSLDEQLFKAVIEDKFTKALNLLDEGANIDENQIKTIISMQNNANYTLLIQAIKNEQNNAVSKLINLGKKLIDKPGGSSKSTPLINAAQEEQLETVEALIKSGADVTLKNKSGNSALTIACKTKNSHITLELLQAGATINFKNKTETDFLNSFKFENGRTLLMTAIKKGYNTAAKELIELGYKYLKVESKSGKNALDFAKLQENYEIKKIINKIFEKEEKKQQEKQKKLEMQKMQNELDEKCEEALETLSKKKVEEAKELLKKIDKLLSEAAEVTENNYKNLYKILVKAKDNEIKISNIKFEIKSQRDDQKNEYAKSILKKFKNHCQNEEKNNSDESTKEEIKIITRNQEKSQVIDDVPGICKEFLQYCNNHNYLELSKMMGWLQFRSDLYKFKKCFDTAAEIFMNVKLSQLPNNSVQKIAIEGLYTIDYKATQDLKLHPEYNTELSGSSYDYYDN